MRIGELASKAGVNIQTIRYYERRNILHPSSVSDAGYRHYQESDLNRLRFIKQTQELGFALSEIEEILELKSGPTSRCRAVRQSATQRLVDVRNKIRSLQRIEAALTGVIEACGKNATSDACPFLEALDP